MPGVSSSAAAPTTAAPAPSPNRMQVARSVQSVRSDSFSAPMTTAYFDAPARIAWSAVASAYEKPEQAVLRAYAAGAGMPGFAAARGATVRQRAIGPHRAAATR